jgi:hypothetical protein
VDDAGKPALKDSRAQGSRWPAQGHPGRTVSMTIERLFPSEGTMIRKLKSGQYRLYSRKVDPKTGKRRNLGTFDTREEAVQHERAVQFFKHRR